MENATIIMIILVLVSLAAGLVMYGVLRERGRGSLVAGCGAIMIGLIVVSCFVLFQIVRILS